MCLQLLLLAVFQLFGSFCGRDVRTVRRKCKETLKSTTKADEDEALLNRRKKEILFLVEPPVSKSKDGEQGFYRKENRSGNESQEKRYSQTEEAGVSRHFF